MFVIGNVYGECDRKRFRNGCQAWTRPLRSRKIERVLLNLLTNAVRHARPNGSVAVVVEQDFDHVVVAVEDDGKRPPAGPRTRNGGGARVAFTLPLAHRAVVRA
jgi:signal transduction histidine kinase